uniref:TEA domain-containing protein n=1 Tax=Macrostomum lignano TaxID=282301 RepID=A0A1I8FGK1_9PLAT
DNVSPPFDHCLCPLFVTLEEDHGQDQPPSRCIGSFLTFSNMSLPTLALSASTPSVSSALRIRALPRRCPPRRGGRRLHCSRTMQGYQQLSSTEHHAAWGAWSTGMMQQQQQHRDAKLAPFESAASVASWSRDRDTRSPISSYPLHRLPTPMLASSLMQLALLQHDQLYGDQPHQPGAQVWTPAWPICKSASNEYLHMQQAGAPVGKQQQQAENKPGIAHEIDKWIASVTCSAPIPGPGVGAPGPNQIAIDKGTLLNFLTRLKMHYQKKREMRIGTVACSAGKIRSHFTSGTPVRSAVPPATRRTQSNTVPMANGNHQSGEQLIDQQPPPPQLGSLQVSSHRRSPELDEH